MNAGRMRTAGSAWTLSAGLLLIVAVLAAVSLLCGSVWLRPSEFTGSDALAQVARLILLDLRLPRLVLTLLIGAALGLSGAVFQGLTRNPLADPALLGVSMGAAFGAVISIYFGLAEHLAIATPLLGLAGAAVSTALTFGLGRGGGTVALILAGAAVSSLMAALTSLALNLAPSPYAAYEITSWLMGSLSDKSWMHVAIAGPFMICGITLLALTGRALDALSLGEVQAASLGVNLQRLQLLAFAGSALAVGAATSIAGAIGFIGLVAAHLVRPLVGHRPGRILLPAALTGAALLLSADLATRLIRFGGELKLGVFTSLLGAPFFFWLVVRLRRNAP